MGSLPNLHELCQDGAGVEDAPAVPPSPYRPGPALGHLCGGAAPPLTPAEKSKILHRYSGHARITKARSNGHDPNKIVYDDFMLEHMAAYSPISSRSARCTGSSNNNNTIRRRDSMSSSIGATSVRRLIAVVRSTNPLGNQGSRGCDRGGSVQHSRRQLLANLGVLCVSHLMITAAFLPFLALQSSVSVWSLASPLTHINFGSWILCVMYFTASISAILGPAILQKLGANLIFLISYLLMIAFYLIHLYPSVYVVVPLGVLLGLCLGPLTSAEITFLMTVASKISYMFSVQDEEEDDDTKAVRKICVVRRLARAFQAAHDFGLILGSVLSALLITYTISNVNNQQYANYNITNGNQTGQSDYNSFLDEIFDTFEGARLCGAQACPPLFASSAAPNSSTLTQGPMSDDDESSREVFHVLPKTTCSVLVIVYASICLVAAMLSAGGLDRIRMYVYQDPLERPEGLAALRGVREAFGDTRLRMAAPLAVFIGLEQAFMYADFSKSYVVCTLGIHRLNLVFLSMGLLQSIAACTLSMLLRSIRRYYVVAVGFTFHACLLMVLILWKPIEDDPALFYVISASWGVCNAIWEMLNFTLLTGLYGDNWESAFAVSTCFRFLGLSTAFALHGLLCNYLKLYALGFFLVVAAVPFVWLEIRLENMRKVKHIVRL